MQAVAAACCDIEACRESGHTPRLDGALLAFQEALQHSGSSRDREQAVEESEDAIEQIVLYQLDCGMHHIHKYVERSPDSQALNAQLQSMSDSLGSLHHRSATPCVIRAYAMYVRFQLRKVPGERMTQLMCEAAQLLQQGPARARRLALATSCKRSGPHRVNISYWPPGRAFEHLTQVTELFMQKIAPQLTPPMEPYGSAGPTCLMEECSAALMTFKYQQPGMRCGHCNQMPSASRILRTCKRCTSVSYCGGCARASASAVRSSL